MNARDKAIVRAVEQAKASQHKTTGFKIEFEAKFGRMLGNERDACGHCDEGYEECSCCEGAGNHYCSDCEEAGSVRCDICEGVGTIENTDRGGDSVRSSCPECEGAGRVDCSNCDGEGRYPCDDCDASGIYQCTFCDGDWQGNDGADNPFVSTEYCHDWLLEYLAERGLAEPSDDGYRPMPQGIPEEIRAGVRPLAHHWQPKKPIAFSKVYHDATVDTEWTVTLSVEKSAKAILYAKVLAEAWNALGAAIQAITGTETDITNAGLHITALNSKGAVYPSGRRQGDNKRYENFRKSMILLMPALYFLAASCDKTRGLQFRAPNISTSKYNAIHFNYGALEFRVFDTCYQKPEQILDNIVVICNSLRYWRMTYRRHHLDQVTGGKPVYFGVEGEYDDLAKQFVTSQHIDLLNRGLKLLKPSYYTVRELKLQRGFTTTKRNTKNLDVQWKLRAETEYKEYERRIGWETVLARHNYIRRFAEDRMFRDNQMVTPEALEEIEKLAEERAKTEVVKRPLEEFVKAKTEEYGRNEVGGFRLA